MTTETTVQPWAEAYARAETGIARSALSSGPEWQAAADVWLRRFIAQWVANNGRGVPFLCEQAREYAEARGFDLPPSKQAWGAVMRRAQREKRVEWHSYAPAHSSNGGPKSQWVPL